MNERIGKAIDSITGFYCYSGMALAFIFGFLMAFEAVAGRIFGFSTTWIMWGSTQVMALLPFFTVAYAMREFQHVRVGIFEAWMSPRTKIWSQIFGYFMFFVFAAVACYYLFYESLDVYRWGQLTEQINFVLWPFYFAATVGCFILCLQTIRSALTLPGQLTTETERHSTFLGSPVFIIGAYIVAIFLSIWIFIIYPPIGVFVMLIVFLFTGIPVSAAIGFLTVVALYIYGGFPFMQSLGQDLYSSMKEFTWFAFPLFVLGGFMMQRGMAAGLFKVINSWIGWVPGGIAVAVIWTAVLLGAMIGSIFATLALLIILGLSEMDKAGYPRSTSLPMIMSASILGYLIPPSITLVVLGGLTDNSIGALFMAGIGPGIMIAVVFSLYMMGYGIAHPELKRYRSTWKECFTNIPPNLPALSVPIVIVGTIAAGLLTPTEAAAVAMVYIFIVNIIRGDMKVNITEFKWIFNQGANVIGFMSFIIVGALLSKYALMHFHVGAEMVDLITGFGLDRLGLLLVVTSVLFLMGCIGETLPIIIIMIPTVFPVLYEFGIHPWWICIYLVFMGAIATLTPPIGAILFVTAGMTDTPPEKLYRHIIPWVLLFFLAIVILYIWPKLVTYIPVYLGFIQPPGFG